MLAPVANRQPPVGFWSVSGGRATSLGIPVASTPPFDTLLSAAPGCRPSSWDRSRETPGVFPTPARVNLITLPSRPQLRGRTKSLVNNSTRSENRLTEPCGYWPFQGSSSLEEQAATKKGESTIEWGSRPKRGTQRAPKPQKKH